jgi:hypothetical protein
MAEALLFRRIATVERDVPVGQVDDWHWAGPQAAFTDWAKRLGSPGLAGRASRLADR